MRHTLEADFIECPDEPEIPWFQVPRSFARDSSLSFEAKGLLTYFMSHTVKYNISIPWIIKNQKISKSKIYKIINECLASGYLKREVFLEQGKKRFKYLVSRTGKFKNILLCPKKQDTEKQDPEKRDTKLEQLSSKEEKEDIPIYKEAQRGDPKASAPPQVSAEADSLCNFFLDKIKDRMPDFKQPNVNKWKLEFDLILRIDKRDPEKIKKIIIWAADHKWWRIGCMSPTKLRRDFDVMMAQYIAEEEKELIRANRLYVLALKEKNQEKMKTLFFDDKYAINRGTGKEIPFNLPTDLFRNHVNSIFGVNPNSAESKKEALKKDGSHKDYKENLKNAEKLVSDMEKAPEHGIIASISGSQELPNSMLTISYRSLKRPKSQNIVVQIFLHNSAHEVLKEIRYHSSRFIQLEKEME